MEDYHIHTNDDSVITIAKLLSIPNEEETGRPNKKVAQKAIDDIREKIIKSGKLDEIDEHMLSCCEAIEQMYKWHDTDAHLKTQRGNVMLDVYKEHSINVVVPKEGDYIVAIRAILEIREARIYESFYDADVHLTKDQVEELYIALGEIIF